MGSSPRAAMERPGSMWQFNRQPDCWVETDRLYADLKRCLEEFASWGGKVDSKKMKREISSDQVNTGWYRTKGKGCAFFFDKDSEAFLKEKESRYFRLTN